MERGVFAQRPQRDARVLIDVALADFHKTSELREAGKPHRDGFCGECVEHHIHALAGGDFHHILREIRAAGVDDVGHAEDF